MVDWAAPIIQVTYSARHSWQANYPCAAPWNGNVCQEGWIELSTNGFATKAELAHWWTFNPSTFSGTYSVDITSLVSGKTGVQIQYRMWMYDDWWWEFDDFSVTAMWGTVIVGLGSATTSITVNNVPPKVYGGPTSGLTGEAIPFNFANYQIDDPTLWDPKTGAWNPTSTEWFAYRWNFDDGTISPWTYTGTLQLPRLRVLFLHTLSGGSGAQFIAMLRSIDVVGTLDTVDFLGLTPAQIPSLSQMLTYDVIMFATNSANFGSTFELTRREIGNRLANYMDITGRGVVTLMATYDLSATYGELFTLLGRYHEEDYGAFEKTQYIFEAHSLGTVYQSNHPVMQGVTRLSSPLITSGDYPLTAGAQLIADWDNGNSAIGVKEMPNGARSVNVGSFSGSGASVMGGDATRFLKNAIVWSSHTVVPTNVIPTLTHVFGDNGLYNVDLQIIDDDMGWAWDSSAGEPVAIQGMDPTISHTVIPVEIYNTDPTIDHASIQAYIASNICLRVAGKEWNTVTLKFFTDGVQSASLQIVRTPGSPNSQAKCALLRIDVLARHSFYSTVEFTPIAGKTHGSNPFWVIIDPWRKINPGHGTTVFSGTFKVQNPAGWVKTMALDNLVRHLFDRGRGAPVEFSATANDAGTDDLAFVWMWEDGTTETVQIHKNMDGSVSQSLISDPRYLGFGEPFFDRSANSIRSPGGTTDFTVRDTAVHTVKVDRDRDGEDDCDDHDDDFDDCGDGHHEGRYEDDDDHDGDWKHANDRDCGCGERGDRDGDHEHDDDDCGDTAPQALWVNLVVLDDDNSRGYSSPFFHDGTDSEFLVVWLS
jgi:hypothetical protein